MIELHQCLKYSEMYLYSLYSKVLVIENFAMLFDIIKNSYTQTLTYIYMYMYTKCMIESFTFIVSRNSSTMHHSSSIPLFSTEETPIT